MVNNSEVLNNTFNALADPTRRSILARLSSGDATVSELAEPFHMTMPAITKHLKVLERAGLISRGRDAQRRPCHLEAGPLKNAAQWIDHYRTFWEGSFGRLEKYLEKLQSEPKKGKRNGNR
jgi:DNA-binding transcriptional ArsR family regulator